MSIAPTPSAEEQLTFLAKVQRLFNEGEFTATYKYALLSALADLAVERGLDDGDELHLRLGDLAERFVILYWRQTAPYALTGAESAPGVLVQNLGAQAAIVTAIEAFRRNTGAVTVQQARAHAQYRELVLAVGTTVSAQPLDKLQNLGGKVEEFLYRRSGRGRITLLPGVAFCLRRFHPLVQRLCRTNWADHIRSNSRNRIYLGGTEDLEDFLFGVPRQSLTALGAYLQLLDGQRCFYCGERATLLDVDHFIPFSLYGRDLAHNFVLAHPQCNRSKSDTLAAKMHTERWLERLARRADAIADIGDSAGIPSDVGTSRKVAAWAYSSALAAGGSAWVRPTQYEAVNSRYVELFDAS